jgi:hypothetical protein
MVKGAGQFNMLEAIPEELWDQLEMMIKARRINKNYLNSFLKETSSCSSLFLFLIPTLFRYKYYDIILITTILPVLISNGAVLTLDQLQVNLFRTIIFKAKWLTILKIR